MYQDYLSDKENRSKEKLKFRKNQDNFDKNSFNLRDERFPRTFDLTDSRFPKPRGSFRRASKRKYTSNSPLTSRSSSDSRFDFFDSNEKVIRNFQNQRKQYRSFNGSANIGQPSRSGSRKYKSSFIRNKPDKKPKLKGVDPQKFIKKAEIRIEETSFVPTIDFQKLNLVDQLKKNLIFRNYVSPTPIQDETIPLIMQGRDVFGLANTGTGKTAAFLIPLIDKVSKDPKQKVLILAPTRELAEQINQELYYFTKHMNIFSVLVVGGLSIYRQIVGLKRSFNFIIGTPGRVKDLYKRGNLKFEQFQTIVLDEVDRMLDMGFVDDIKFVASKLPEQRHTLFFSATSTKDVESVMNLFLKTDHVKVSVKTGDTTDNVDQDVVWLNTENEKLTTLINFLERKLGQKIIVFLRTKIGVDKLELELKKRGFRVSGIHGDRTQSSRRRSLRDFKSGSTKILLATDVAARGLDIPNVEIVINYDAPESFENYVHRIGRTGRAGKSGNAITYVVK